MTVAVTVFTLVANLGFALYYLHEGARWSTVLHATLGLFAIRLLDRDLRREGR